MRMIISMDQNLTLTVIFILSKMYSLGFCASISQKNHLMRLVLFIQKMCCLSLCHMNIRSIKADHLGDFDNYMRMLNLDFSIIGVTETWLNDVTCELYGMGGYEFIAKHRTNKVGGSIGFFVMNGVSYKPGGGLTIFEHYCESMFSGID